jgi:hypothetical protein
MIVKSVLCAMSCVLLSVVAQAAWVDVEVSSTPFNPPGYSYPIKKLKVVGIGFGTSEQVINATTAVSVGWHNGSQSQSYPDPGFSWGWGTLAGQSGY